jgi:hypothetical protein
MACFISCYQQRLKMISGALRRELPNITYESDEIIKVNLMKRRPGCTGMFWRADPTLTKTLENNNNWPRDGAKLRGKVVIVDGVKWLLASEVQNKGQGWVKAPGGAAMPFEYDNHYYLEQSKSETEVDEA